MRGLVLSGGGANGAFEVGALQHILGEKKVHYDVICGVSVGALNGSLLAQYPAGEEETAIEHLSRVWAMVRGDSDIYRKWYYGVLWHLPVLWHHSVYCTKPLQEIVQKNLDPERLLRSGKKLRVGAVCWTNGQYQIWEEKSPEIVEAVLASSAFPLFFEPVQVGGLWYTDGGLRDVTPIKAAIDFGCERIDVIQCGSRSILNESKKLPWLAKQIKNGLDIVFDEIDVNDYEKAQMVNELVKAGVDTEHRLVELHRIRPSLPLGDSLDFSRSRQSDMMDLGRRLARAYTSW
jgi:NTE family protein